MNPGMCFFFVFHLLITAFYMLIFTSLWLYRCKHLNRLVLLKEEMVLQSFTAETDVLESYTDKAEKLYNNLGIRRIY